MTQDKETQGTESVNLTKSDLAQLITSAVTAAVAAMKAPSALEQKKIDAEERSIAADQANRLKTAKSVLEDIDNKRLTQATCSHEHSNGFSHCVYVQERVGPGYLICQKNQCIIRSGEASPNYKGTVIYDTALFNKIFQKVGQTGEIFG